MSELIPASDLPEPLLPEILLRDVRELIVEARRQITAAVKVGLTRHYWRFGNRVRR